MVEARKARQFVTFLRMFRVERNEAKQLKSKQDLGRFHLWTRMGSFLAGRLVVDSLGEIRPMSIDWVPPIIGLLFVVIWLISFQAILAEHSSPSNLPVRPAPPGSDPSKPTALGSRLD